MKNMNKPDRVRASGCNRFDRWRRPLIRVSPLSKLLRRVMLDDLWAKMCLARVRDQIVPNFARLEFLLNACRLLPEASSRVYNGLVVAQSAPKGDARAHLG